MTKAPLLAAALLASAVWAQTPEDVIDPVSGQTVGELVARAIGQNGELLAGRQQIAAARGDLLQAGLRANPSIEASGMKEVAGPMNNFMIGGSLPLELFHRRDRRVDVAQGGVKLSEFSQADRERRLRAAVESKFGDVLAALRNFQFTVDLLGLNRKALELTEIRAEQGAAPRLDADLLRVEVNRIDSLRADFEAQFGVNLLELKSLVGIAPGEALPLQGALSSPPVTIAQDESLRRALAARPDLLSARAAEEVAQARLRQARTEGRLDASVAASYERSDSGFGLNGLTATGQLRRIQGIFHLVSVGVSISLPVRNRNEGTAAAAAAEVEAVRRRREYAELIVAQEVAAAYLMQAKARESVDIYDRGVRGQAEQNLAVIRRVYELGRSQVLDVIAEQRRLIDVEMGYTDAMNRYYQAAVRVRAAAGLE
jgi:cobalt-zinc-cadmium efflux system outer membrane protein